MDIPLMRYFIQEFDMRKELIEILKELGVFVTEEEIKNIVTERIMFAAIKGPKIIVGNNHAECFSNLKQEQQQGFYTSFGRFVDRKEALEIAMNAGQVKKKHLPIHMLMSEDLKHEN